MLVLTLAIGGWWGLRMRARHRSQSEFDRAWTAMRNGGSVRPAQQFVVEHESDEAFQPHVSVLQGALRLKAGDPREAFQILSQTETLDSVRIQSLLLMGESLYQMGDLTESERAFRTVADESPDNVVAHRWLATIYHDIGAMVGAMGELQIVSRLQPNDHLPYLLMGQLQLLDFGDYKGAAASLRKALALNPPPKNEAVIRLDLARALVAHHDYRGALQVLKPLPESAAVLTQRAECHWSLGDKRMAQADLDKARQLDPKDRKARFLEARWWIEQREPAKAAVTLKELLGEDPHDNLARYQLALAYRLSGDVTNSQAELETMQHSRARRLRLRELYEKATRSPTDVKTREEIVRLLDELGQPDLATVWRRALVAVRKAQPANP